MTYGWYCRKCSFYHAFPAPRCVMCLELQVSRDDMRNFVLGKYIPQNNARNNANAIGLAGDGLVKAKGSQAPVATKNSTGAIRNPYAKKRKTTTPVMQKHPSSSSVIPGPLRPFNEAGAVLPQSGVSSSPGSCGPVRTGSAQSAPNRSSLREVVTQTSVSSNAVNGGRPQSNHSVTLHTSNEKFSTNAAVLKNQPRPTVGCAQPSNSTRVLQPKSAHNCPDNQRQGAVPPSLNQVRISNDNDAIKKRSSADTTLPPVQNRLDTWETRENRQANNSMDAVSDHNARVSSRNNLANRQLQNLSRQTTLNCFKRKTTVQKPSVVGVFEPGPVPFDNVSAKKWIYPVNSNFPIRDYQLQISETAVLYNTLVSLPTGLGKTLIAAVVLYNFYRWFPTGSVVFLAPTLPLVNQQVSACYDIMGIPAKDTAILTGKVSPAGRAALWRDRRVFFCTPQTVEKDIEAGRCPAKSVVCLVLDEAHRASGEYAYTRVVKQIELTGGKFRILGLSATPGTSIKSIQNVVELLRISKIEARLEDDPNVKQYIHKRHSEIIIVKQASVVSTIERKLDVVINPLLDRLRAGNGLSRGRGLGTLTSYCMIKDRQEYAKRTNGDRSLDGLFFAAQKFIGIRNDIRSCGIGVARTKLIRLQNDAKGGIISKILKGDSFRELWEAVSNMTCDPDKISGKESAQDRKLNNPKLAKLDEILTEHFERALARNESSRAFVFSSSRESVSEIVDVLSESRLIRPRHFVGQSKAGGTRNAKSSGDGTNPLSISMDGMKQKEQQQVIREFLNDKYNVLVCTCIGEEGLDIGEVDLIVEFDTSKSAIRSIQRGGRTGRKRDGRIVKLISEGQEERNYQQAKHSESTLGRALSKPDKFKVARNRPMFPVNPKLEKQEMTIEKFRLSQIGGQERPVRGRDHLGKPTQADYHVDWKLTKDQERERRMMLGRLRCVGQQEICNDRELVPFPTTLKRIFVRARELGNPHRLKEQLEKRQVGSTCSILLLMEDKFVRQDISREASNVDTRRLLNRQNVFEHLFPVKKFANSCGISPIDHIATDSVSWSRDGDPDMHGWVESTGRPRQVDIVKISDRENALESETSLIPEAASDAFLVENGDATEEKSGGDAESRAKHHPLATHTLQRGDLSTAPPCIETGREAEIEANTKSSSSPQNVALELNPGEFCLPSQHESSGSSCSDEVSKTSDHKLTEKICSRVQTAAILHKSPIGTTVEYVANSEIFDNLSQEGCSADASTCSVTGSKCLLSNATNDEKRNEASHVPCSESQVLCLPSQVSSSSSATASVNSCDSHQTENLKQAFDSGSTTSENTRRLYSKCPSDQQHNNRTQCKDERGRESTGVSQRTIVQNENIHPEPQRKVIVVETSTDVQDKVTESCLLSAEDSNQARTLSASDDVCRRPCTAWHCLKGKGGRRVLLSQASPSDGQSIESHGLVDTPTPLSSEVQPKVKKSPNIERCGMSMDSHVLKDTPETAKQEAVSAGFQDVCNDIVCGICYGGDSTDDDPIVLCDGPENDYSCKVAVHKSCYKISACLEKQDYWRCDVCQIVHDRLSCGSTAADINSSLRCSVCFNSDGPLWKQSAQDVIHPLCKGWSEKDNKTPCTFCGLRGGTPCAADQCSAVSHPHCAVRHHWTLLEIRGHPNGAESDITPCHLMFCDQHKDQVKCIYENRGVQCPNIEELPRVVFLQAEENKPRFIAENDLNTLKRKRLRKGPGKKSKTEGAAVVDANATNPGRDSARQACKRQRLQLRVGRRSRKKFEFIDDEAKAASENESEADALEEQEARRIEEDELSHASFINDSSQLGHTQDNLDHALGSKTDHDSVCNNVHRHVDIEAQRRSMFATPVFNRRMKREKPGRSGTECNVSLSAPSSEKGLGNMHFIRSVIEHHRQGGRAEEIEEVYHRLANECPESQSELITKLPPSTEVPTTSGIENAHFARPTPKPVSDEEEPTSRMQQQATMNETAQNPLAPPEQKLLAKHFSMSNAQLTNEQRAKIEANRQAALRKRKLKRQRNGDGKVTS